MPDDPPLSGEEAPRNPRDPAADGPAPPRTLGAVRHEIDRVDEEILERLARRRTLSAEMAAAKGAGSPVRDPEREAELLSRLIRAGRERGLAAHFVTQVFGEILDDSIRLQHRRLQRQTDPEAEPERIRVAIQGLCGSYSQLAARAHFAEHAEWLSYVERPSFAEVVAAVERGQADYAMLPIENTISGGITEIHELLLETRLSIVGEERFRVRHCLVGSGPVPPAQIRRILSHPQAVAQCSEFLSRLEGCQVESFADTAMAVAHVKDAGDASQAAIASEEAAAMYGLHVIRRELANRPENYTRFLVAARGPCRVDVRIPCKTSVLIATSQPPDSLVEALLVFRERGLNLVKLDSRSIRGKPWEEMYYVDFEGNVAEESVQRALAELARVTCFIKLLGSYPSRARPEGARENSRLTSR